MSCAEEACWWSGGMKGRARLTPRDGVGQRVQYVRLPAAEEPDEGRQQSTKVTEGRHQRRRWSSATCQHARATDLVLYFVRGRG
jgi:hypothetical protein